MNNIAGIPDIGEGMLVAFMPRLMNRDGFYHNGKRIHIERQNEQNKYLPDWGLFVDYELIGVIDPETKGPAVSYIFDNPACNISVPRWTWKYHMGKTTRRNETNKIKAYREMTGGSFWIGMKDTYKMAFAIHARDILSSEIIDVERGNFTRPLTIFDVPRSKCRMCEIATTDLEEFIIEKLEKENLI